jgi:hypothetical protein
MKSVRMLAAGAVALFALPVLTAPVRACDDRFIKKCEAESEAAFLAEQPAAWPVVRRKNARPRAAAAVEKPEARRAPRFVRPVRAEPVLALAAGEQRPAALPDSPLARRFRGFIDPQPMTVNSFEDLRRPRLDAEHLAPAAALPANESVARPDEVVRVDVSAAAVPAAVVTVPPPQAAAAPVAVAEAGMPPPVFAQSVTPSSDDSAPAGFPVHKLVLTLCGALGVAAALRFIVRA